MVQKPQRTSSSITIACWTSENISNSDKTADKILYEGMVSLWANFELIIIESQWIVKLIFWIYPLPFSDVITMP